ncbi:hypothetical protein Syun_025421 [Stephania yunnanensis]|uniref:Uncharacterized protein n=1 Tax=Stephania yunnanensis TaxID=152371 RepID=A0AAP0ERM5_9MAGN
MEDINRHLEETSTTGRGTLSHHATHAHSDGRYSLHYTHGWSYVTRPYSTYAPGPSSSHYTSSSPLGHPNSYQHGTPSPPVHALPAQHGIIPSSSHHFTPSPPVDGHPHDHGFRPSSSHHATPSPSAYPAHSSARSSSNRLRSSIPNAIEEIPDFVRPPTTPAEGENPLIYLIAEHGLYVFFTWDSQMSFAIHDVWCRKAAIWYMGNIYLIAKKRIAPIYLTDEVFEHYKRMRATDETFKKKSKQMSTNRKSEVEGPGTAKLTRRLEEMSTQTPDTSIDEDAVYLEVVPEVKGRVYGLGSQGYHRYISLGEASSSRGPAYGLHELEELQWDHQRLQETLLKERIERQDQMQRDKMERQEENREIQDRLARTEALLMQHLGIRPHVPPTPRIPPSLVTQHSGPQSDDQPGHLTTEIAFSQTAPPDDHQHGHWINPHRRMPEDQRHLLDDNDEFMSQLMLPPRPPLRTCTGDILYECCIGEASPAPEAMIRTHEVLYAHGV